MENSLIIIMLLKNYPHFQPTKASRKLAMQVLGERELLSKMIQSNYKRGEAFKKPIKKLSHKLGHLSPTISFSYLI